MPADSYRTVQCCQCRRTESHKNATESGEKGGLQKSSSMHSNKRHQALDQAKSTLQRSEAQLRSYSEMGTGKAQYIRDLPFMTFCT